MNTPTETETLLGGAELTIERIVPPAKAGDKPQRVQETVFVRQLPVKTYPLIGQLQGADNELSILELYCGQPAGWAETLVPADYIRALEEGERQNQSFFDWAARRLKRLERESPGMVQQLVEKALAQKNVSGPSVPTAPRPRPV